MFGVPGRPRIGGAQMKAIVCRTHGTPDVLKLEEIAKPDIPPNGVLVRVHASSANIVDLFALTRAAFMSRTASRNHTPTRDVPGADFAGTVEAVGESVTQFQPGDEVF